jgi:hypothetical protein
MARVIAELDTRGVPLKRVAALVGVSYKTTLRLRRLAVHRATVPGVVTRIAADGSATVVRT